jgi:hypothetical protein
MTEIRAERDDVAGNRSPLVPTPFQRTDSKGIEREPFHPAENLGGGVLRGDRTLSEVCLTQPDRSSPSLPPPPVEAGSFLPSSASTADRNAQATGGSP